MRPSLTSVAKFALAAAVLFWLWAGRGWSDSYAQAVVVAASPLIRLTTEYRVSRVDAQPHGVNVYIAGKGEELIVPLQPREQFSGIVPFLAMVLATPALARSRRITAVVAGTAALFAFHIALTVLGPFLATPHLPWINRVIDVTYGFVGLVGYVALPFVLWFTLTARSADAGTSD